jgi:hypothetical protein
MLRDFSFDKGGVNFAHNRYMTRCLDYMIHTFCILLEYVPYYSRLKRKKATSFHLWLRNDYGLELVLHHYLIQGMYHSVGRGQIMAQYLGSFNPYMTVFNVYMQFLTV